MKIKDLSRDQIIAICDNVKYVHCMTEKCPLVDMAIGGCADSTYSQLSVEALDREVEVEE